MQTFRGVTWGTVKSACQVSLPITSAPFSPLTELHAGCDAALPFCNSTSFLQCGRTPAWQNRRQKAVNRRLYVCAGGAWHSNLTKFPLIYNVSFFNFGGLELCLGS